VFRMGDGKGGALNFCEVKSGLLNNMWTNFRFQMFKYAHTQDVEKR
jgi:hypothetical protein